MLAKVLIWKKFVFTTANVRCRGFCPKNFMFSFTCHPFVVLVSFLPLSALSLSLNVFYCSFSQKLSLFGQFVGVSAHISSVCLCLMSNKEQKYESAPLPSLSAGTIKIPLLCCPKERAPARMTSFCLRHEPAPPYFSKSRCASGLP
jgi:hypothetical protein